MRGFYGLQFFVMFLCPLSLGTEAIPGFHRTVFKRSLDFTWFFRYWSKVFQVLDFRFLLVLDLLHKSRFTCECFQVLTAVCCKNKYLQQFSIRDTTYSRMLKCAKKGQQETVCKLT